MFCLYDALGKKIQLCCTNHAFSFCSDICIAILDTMCARKQTPQVELLKAQVKSQKQILADIAAESGEHDATAAAEYEPDGAAFERGQHADVDAEPFDLNMTAPTSNSVTADTTRMFTSQSSSD